MTAQMGENKIERILTIYRKLCDGETVNKAEMAAKFQVNTRSIQRDIDDLRAYFSNQWMSATGMGRAILYDRTKKGYYLDNGIEKMTSGELLAVCKILLESRAFTKPEMQPILKKILCNCLPMSGQKEVMELIANEMYHYIEPHHQTKIVDNLWGIGKAVKDQQYIQIYYKKLKGDPVSRKIKPVGIMFSEFYFYLIAFIEEEKEEKYLSPAIYRIDRIQSFQVLKEHFSVPYRMRFEEGEFRKRVQFMHGGKLQRIVFEYTGIFIEAVLDRLPTAEVIEEKISDNTQRKTYVIRAEVFGDGIDMWIRSQGENLQVISRKEIG